MEQARSEGSSGIEAIECYSSWGLGTPIPAEGTLCWAKIVWIDRSVPHCDPKLVVGRWIARGCEDGRCPWIHNQTYQVRNNGEPQFLRVKVGDIRDCSERRSAPIG